jgi:hypothetical protein
MAFSGWPTCVFPKQWILFRRFPDRKERLFYQFTMTDRASARFCESFAFLEDKAAFEALCRTDDEMPVPPGHRFMDVVEVSVHFLFRDSDACRDLLCRECPAFQSRNDLMPYGIGSLLRDGGLFGFFSHEISVQEYHSKCKA